MDKTSISFGALINTRRGWGDGLGLGFFPESFLNCKSCGSFKKSKHSVKKQLSCSKLQYELYAVFLLSLAFHPNDLEVPHVYIVSIKSQLLFLSTK